jgi:hypothetical protein
MPLHDSAVLVLAWPWRMQRARVARMQQPGEGLAVGVVFLHRRLEQGLLNVAGHVAPDGKRGITEHKGKSPFIIQHRSSPNYAHSRDKNRDGCCHAAARPRPDQGTNNSCRRSQPINARETLMGLFAKDIKTMEDLLLHGLRDIYYAEQQIRKHCRR